MSLVQRREAAEVIAFDRRSGAVDYNEFIEYFKVFYAERQKIISSADAGGHLRRRSDCRNDCRCLRKC